MKRYYVHITETAERDLNRAADYIEFSLKNPQAADDLVDEAETALSSLGHLPERYALADDKLLAALGIRFIQIKSYLAFYAIDQAAGTVHILRFLYGKSDWRFILHHGITSE